MLTTPRTVLRDFRGVYVLALLLCSSLFPSAASAGWRSSGPFGGEAELVRVVPKSPGFVLAGSHNGLLFASRNGAASWNNIPFSGQLSGSLHAMEVDPRSE